MIWLSFLALLAAAGSDYGKELEKWRASEEAALRSQSGWLTLAGLEWLKEGRNRIAMPAGAPDFGIFELSGRNVTLHPADGGAPVPLKSDMSDDPDRIERAGYSVQVIERGLRIGIRIRNANSPVRQHFTGMKWFPEREEYRIEAKWEPYDPPKTIRIPNVLGDVNEEISPGRAHFRLNGADCSLEPVESGSGLFLIFRDGTSGNETYGAGRFLYADKPSGGKLILDFNRAVNPPCAFTPYATCPLPPRQNRLTVRIEAGELAPAPH